MNNVILLRYNLCKYHRNNLHVSRVDWGVICPYLTIKIPMSILEEKFWQVFDQPNTAKQKTMGLAISLVSIYRVPKIKKSDFSIFVI